MSEQEVREKIAKEIEALIIKNQAHDWNEERIGGLELALDIVWGRE